MCRQTGAVRAFHIQNFIRILSNLLVRSGIILRNVIENTLVLQFAQRLIDLIHKCLVTLCDYERIVLLNKVLLENLKPFVLLHKCQRRQFVNNHAV